MESAVPGAAQGGARSASRDSLKVFLAGGAGGASMVLVGHPADTIKVKMQVDPTLKSVRQCARETVQREGVRGLYRGMLAPLASVTPNFAVYFWAFDGAKQLLARLEGVEPQDVSTGSVIAAGAASAIPGTIVLCPGDRIKVMLQAQGKGGPLRGPLDCIRQQGLRGLYKGASATLLRDAPGSAAYYSGYELPRRALQRRQEAPLGPLSIMGCGAVAGAVNWLVCLPPDVVKSRLQAAPSGRYPGGMRQVASEVMASEGLAGFYKGLAPALLRAVPGNAACFLAVETTKRVLDRLF